MNKQRSMLWIVVVLATLVLSCSILQPDPETIRKHPWLVQPLRQETKAYFCQKLNLKPEHQVCRPDRNTLAIDLLRPLQERFPEHKTYYSEVAEALKGYPVEAEDSVAPNGTVTSRSYVYILTEFDGFCIYFGVRDLQSGLVERIDSSSVGSGPSPATCGSEKLRAQPRPFLTTP